MTEEIAELVNRLAIIEEEIAILWDYHQDNPDRINVEDRFTELQREALSIGSYLDQNNIEIEEDELPF